ncbi:MAG: hypothetical protein PF440_12020 [Thiomicrorhabdus sp.]|jgi:hypothetical protein|nr:hypothetical protein [Thiomicrorhabdus sp.]
MNISKNDISTWPKTADILYMSDDFQVAETLLFLERRYYDRPYNIRRIKGRMKRLYTKSLVYNSEMSLHGIKPTKLKNAENILIDAATLRAYVKLMTVNLFQLYGLMRYEYEHKNRKDIKRVLATQIIKGGDYGVGKRH